MCLSRWNNFHFQNFDAKISILTDSSLLSVSNFERYLSTTFTCRLLDVYLSFTWRLLDHDGINNRRPQRFFIHSADRALVWLVWKAIGRYCREPILARTLAPSLKIQLRLFIWIIYSWFQIGLKQKILAHCDQKNCNIQTSIFDCSPIRFFYTWNFAIYD